jgi:dTDP-4-dehydrorhamnose 3,5-epimerase-like enzyme
MLYELIYLKKMGTNEQGYLSFFEGNKNIPFKIKRIYYTYGVPVGAKRGMHAHKNLQQVMWCPYGSVEVVIDDGSVKEGILLDSPEKLLVLRKGLWRDMYWEKPGSVLCVAVSDYYNEDDYIRDYAEYLHYVEEGYWEDEDKL